MHPRDPAANETSAKESHAPGEILMIPQDQLLPLINDSMVETYNRLFKSLAVVLVAV